MSSTLNLNETVFFLIKIEGGIIQVQILHYIYNLVHFSDKPSSISGPAAAKLVSH